MITQEELKRLVSYDKDTGEFVWLDRSAGSTFNKRLVGGLATQLTKSTGYYRILICGKSYRAHRLAWLYVYGSLPVGEIDHINGIRADNRIANLRDVSHSENLRNLRIPKDNTTGIIGVKREKRNGTWSAHIRVNRKQIHLGTFKHIFDAACARRSAEIKYGFHKNHGRAPAQCAAQLTNSEQSERASA